MSLPLLAAVTLAALAAGYLLYGRIVARAFGLDDARPTPAETVNDGTDHVPTPPFYLLGQHFSAIAAAGPIVGPIAACLAFGWAPCLLWIGLGVIFIGAVHDFAALAASVRHKAGSIVEIVRANLGRRAWLAMLCFIWIALVFVIVAFTDVTAGTFAARSPDEKGGAVAAASILYLGLAVLMGALQKKFNPPLWLMTVIFVPATLGAVWVGTQVPGLMLADKKLWTVLILVYCFVAAQIPVWLLLQPRGYLGGFVLYMALAVGVVGIFSGRFEVAQPAFREIPGTRMTDLLFPFLFVTIACGACSGFHGLVCSGTTSKQVARESHCKPVGYGGMLLEGFVALIALSTIMIAAKPGATPDAIYAEGIGRYLTVLIGEQHLGFAVVFGAMVFSTFVFDTLDVAARLGRYLLQELTGRKGPVAAIVATAVTAAVPLALLLMAKKDKAWLDYWTLFGTSNQLLAALTLLAITVWLKRQGRPIWFTLLPMIGVMAVTVTALVIQAAAPWVPQWKGSSVNSAVAAVLLVLAMWVVAEALLALRRRPAEALTA